jgi:hypothetical protein
MSSSPPVTAADWFWLRSASLYLATVEGTVVNVAIPALAAQLPASNLQMQRIADADTLTFDGLLRAPIEAARLHGDTS